jgi:hypothetical protein
LLENSRDEERVYAIEEVMAEVAVRLAQKQEQLPHELRLDGVFVDLLVDLPVQSQTVLLETEDERLELLVELSLFGERVVRCERDAKTAQKRNLVAQDVPVPATML